MIRRLISDPRYAFVRFIFVGGLNTVFGYSVYTTLYLLGLTPHRALIGAFCVGVIWNYFTHARLVFATKGFRRMPPYILAYVGLYFLNAAGLEALLGAGVSPVIAQGMLVLPAAALAFVVIGRVLTGRFPWQRPPAGAAALHSSGSSPQ